ncbi:uncharacterized protein LOC122504629 [Leptopilina heterotoma]|uniref:uncharacterized protein LOC122504629 n=1 Tax=Leptopilina heterotoma TaxID=63436 RepID=UPI001CA87EA6|nr:uncharacterized protein LOC122504629 [Leptopilina heterotoma]
MGENNEIMTLLREVQSDVQSSNKKLDTVVKDMDDLKVSNEKLSSEFKVHKVKYEQIQKTNEILQQKVDSCEQKLNFILNKERARNLLLFKVPDNQEVNKDLYNSVMNIFIKASVNIPDSCIVNTTRLGRIEGSRPILISFTSQKWKSIIFSKARNFGEMKIGLGNDLTREERQKRKSDYELLMKYKGVLLQQGKECTIKGMRLIINDTEMNVDEIKDILKNQKDDIDSDTENDNSSFSRTSNTSRKRVRTIGDKDDIKKKQKKLVKSTVNSLIKAFLLKDVSQKNMPDTSSPPAENK